MANSCKAREQVIADDFFRSGLNKPGNTNNQAGSNVTTINVDQFPGLNSLGISLVRIGYAPGGQNPPQIHPRANEILLFQQGILYVGFVSSNQDQNRLLTKVLYPGDVFVFPEALIHFQHNVVYTGAVAFAALSSIAKSVFGSNPDINPDVLSSAFLLYANLVKNLQYKF